MSKSTNSSLKGRIAGFDAKKKVVMGAVGVLALAGLGVGAASAATPVHAPSHSSSSSSTTSQTTRPTADTPTTGDTADTSETVDTADQNEKPGAAETADDNGPDSQQTGDHQEPGDLPNSP